MTTILGYIIAFYIFMAVTLRLMPYLQSLVQSLSAVPEDLARIKSDYEKLSAWLKTKFQKHQRRPHDEDNQ